MCLKILPFLMLIFVIKLRVCKALCRSQEFVADHDDVVVKGMKGWGKRRGKGGKVCLNSRAYTHLLFC